LPVLLALFPQRVSAAPSSGSSSQNLASAKTVAAVVSLSRSDRRLAETVDAWDRDQGRLNVPEGTADLNADPGTLQ
jgi:hypothetical protein